VTSGAYPTWFALSACCTAASGRMLMASLDNRFFAQAWLSATTFALWSALTTVFFWGMV
jgi:hypothetical protein